MISTDELEQIAYEARNDIPEPWGYCFPASKYIHKKIVKNYEIPEDKVSKREVRVGSSGTIRHYVVSLHSRFIKDIDYNGLVFIDPTIEQYCDENYDNGDVEFTYGPREEIDEVGIYLSASHPYTSA